jgi:hypothetical protein
MSRRDREVIAPAVAEHDDRPALVGRDHLDGVERVDVDAESLGDLRALAEPNDVVASELQPALVLGAVVLRRRRAAAAGQHNEPTRTRNG